jgi:uncharacterized damage-inducible protein DinB
MTQQVEVWLRGPVEGVAAELQPVAHALLQVREDLERLLGGADRAELWVEPGGAASAAFHVVHLAGSLERLLTYARGEQLGGAQLERLRAERQPDRAQDAADLLRLGHAALDAALRQVRSTDPATLDERRSVGRAALPATVRGLLFHAAEHATRHAGQLATTLKIVAGTRAAG